MNDINNFLINNFLNWKLLLGFIVGLYFLRNPLKALIGNIISYRTGLDDYSFIQHQNRDLMYKNQQTILYTDKTFLNFGILVFIFSLAILNTYLFLVCWFVFRAITSKQILSKMQDFKYFNNIDEKDYLMNLLNSKHDKFNYIINEIWFNVYILLGISLKLQNGFMQYVSLYLAIGLLAVNFFIVYNIYMLKQNYKYVMFYRGLRLLQSSSLLSMFPIFALGLLAIIFTPTHIFGTLAFILCVKLFLRYTVNTFLKEQDMLSDEHSKIENREYKNIEALSSYPNPLSQSRGYKFTTPLQLKFFEIEKEKNGKNLIHLDNYAFYQQAKNRSVLRKNPIMLENITKNVKTKLEALDFTKQIVILGGMGSGKTEMINYLVQQVHESKFTNFQSVIFNDIKGDFTKQFYREDKDFILNIFDKRSAVWDIFTEMDYNIEAGANFVSNLYTSISGDEKDFFSGRAKQLTTEFIQSAYFSAKDNYEAWDIFFEKLDNFEKEILDEDDKTKGSILQTMQIAMDILKIMKYQICVEKRKIFCINDFLRATDTQVFLQNNKQYEEKLTPYLTGILGAISGAFMAKEDTKEHLVLNILDEFLSLKMEESTRKTTMTATRSKGSCNIIASIYLPNDDKIIQDIDSSRYALVTFNINDEFTLNKVREKMAKSESLNITSSYSKSWGIGSKYNNNHRSKSSFFQSFKNSIFANEDNPSYALGETEILLTQQLQSMPKYHHLTFIPSEEIKYIEPREERRFFKLFAFGYDKLMGSVALENDFIAKESGILYLGYTPRATMNFNSESFVKWEMRDYFVQTGNIKVSDTLISSMSEEQLLETYLTIKFAGSEEKATEHIEKANLQNANFEEIFIAVEESADKVKLLKERYSEDERFEILKKFYSFENYHDLYLYCKEKNIIGALVGIFEFNEKYLEEKGV